MPVLLRCGLGFSALFAGFGVLVLAVFLGAFLFASRPTVDGQEISRLALLAQQSLVWILFPVLVLWFGVIALAFYRELAWSRTAIVALWLGYGFLSAGFQVTTPEPWSEFMPAFVGWGVGFALVLGYFYGTPRVRRYYDAIAARSGEAPALPRAEA
jgi:hypothetical protein